MYDYNCQKWYVEQVNKFGTEILISFFKKIYLEDAKAHLLGGFLFSIKGVMICSWGVLQWLIISHVAYKIDMVLKKEPPVKEAVS